MKTRFGWLFVGASVVVTATLAFSVSPPAGNELGFGVEIIPHEELDGFYSCRLTLFDVRTDTRVASQTITTIKDDGNGMRFRNADGTDVDFDCAVNADGTEASYEIRGSRDNRPIISHVATVHLP